MARIKAEERLLSYHDKGRCWRKFYRGKMHYLDPRGVSKSDDAAYRLALKNWKAKKSEYDVQLALLESETEPTTVSALKLAQALNVQAAMEGTPERGPVDRQHSIAGLVDAYIATKKALADAGGISRQMLIEYEHNAKVFAEWAEQSGFTRTDQINSGCLDQYRQFVLRLRNPEFARKAETPALGLVSIRKRLARLKNMIEWAYETEHLEALPRNIRGLAKVRVENGHDEAEKPAEELFWTTEEARQLFKAASPRTRLYILLAANCAYTQTDIATLRHAHIDWVRGIITRPRHKTKGKTCHKLWPMTLELLKAEATKPDKRQPGNGRVLVGQKGLPLIYESEKSTTRQDTVRLAFAMVQKTLIKQRLRQTRPDLFKLATRKRGDMSKDQLAGTRLP